MIGIYKIENTVNGKVYIGQSVDITDRWEHHRSELKNNRHGNAHLQASWNKYGEDSFTFTVLEECTRKELQEREKDWISFYDSYSNGYNQTLGGDGTKIINPILQFDSYFNFIKEWDNGIIASEETGINASSIYGCCNERIKKAGGYIWIYKKDYKDKLSLRTYMQNNRQCPVNQYDPYGKLIKQWDSCSQIIREIDLNPIDCLRHNKKSYKGYVWRYINDLEDLTNEYFADIRNSSLKLLPKTIVQLSKIDKSIIATYKTANEAQRHGHHKTMVRNAIANNKIYHDSYWKYDYAI